MTPVKRMPEEIVIEGRECLFWKNQDLWRIIEFNYQLREWVTLARSPYRDEAIEDARKVIRAHPRPIRRPLVNAPANWPPPYKIVLETGETC